MRIPFYFDYTCPWAYIGSTRVERYFADLGVEIDFKPVYLKQMREPMQGPAPETEQTYGPRKAAYYAADRTHWAEACGAQFGDPDRLVRADTALLLKAALVAQDEGRFGQFHHRAYRARWVDAEDVSEPRVVRALLAGADLDADRCLERARGPALDRRLAAVTEEAIAAGVFGVPTIVIGGRVLWGNDHFEVARYYAGKALAEEAA